MPTRTVIQLRHGAARRVRDLWTGTLTQPATVGDLTLHDAKRIESRAYFGNGFLHVGADATAEDHRLIGNESGGITMANDGGISTARIAGTAYEIHKLMAVEDYNAHIADAVLSAGPEGVLSNVDDQTLVVAANAAKPGGFEDEYTIPSGIKYINEVSVEDSAGVFRYRVPNDQLKVIGGKLRFSGWAVGCFEAAGRNIRIIGQGAATVPSLADTSTVAIDADFIMSYVELQALIPIAGGQGARARAASQRVQALTQLLEVKRLEVGTTHRVLPGSLIVAD